MTAYTATSVPSGDYAHWDTVWQEFDIIETSLGASYGFFSTEVNVGTVAQGVPLTTLSGLIRVPVAASLQSVHLFCGTRLGDADPTGDVYDTSPASILSGLITFAADATSYPGTLASAETAAAGDLYTVRADTNGANEAFTAFGCSMVWKAT